MNPFEVMVGLFFCATLVAFAFGAYLIGELKHCFHEEYRSAGSPSWFWNDRRAWAFLGYVLSGKFVSIPDRSLVRQFQFYRGLEAARLALVLGILFLVLAH